MGKKKQKVMYCVISSAMIDEPEMRCIYSWSDDPEDALQEARIRKSCARWRMLWYKYGDKGK